MSRYARAKAALERSLVTGTTTLELEGLPVALGRPGLQVDTTTGRGSIDVGSYREATGVLLGSGVRRLEFVVFVNGKRMTAGELLAAAAWEFGDFRASRRILAQVRTDLVDAVSPTGAARGPRRHGCDGGLRA